MEQRLIYANVLINAIPETNVDVFENCRNCSLLSKEDIVDIINEQPTVEAEIVKHGKWLHGQAAEIVMQDATISSVTYLNWHCSECGYPLDGGDFASVLYHYCPNCGAKMDGASVPFKDESEEK